MRMISTCLGVCCVCVSMCEQACQIAAIVVRMAWKPCNNNNV